MILWLLAICFRSEDCIASPKYLKWRSCANLPCFVIKGFILWLSYSIMGVSIWDIDWSFGQFHVVFPLYVLLEFWSVIIAIIPSKVRHLILIWFSFFDTNLDALYLKFPFPDDQYFQEQY